MSKNYRLVVGDKLRIEVYKDPQLSQSVGIRPDGKITLPLVGDITAAGATPIQLANTLTGRLREYVIGQSVVNLCVVGTPADIERLVATHAIDRIFVGLSVADGSRSANCCERSCAVCASRT